MASSRSLQPLVRLLERAASAAPSEFAGIVSEEARAWSAFEVVIYLIDYEQRQLVPLPSPDAADRTVQSVGGSLAGRCFRTTTIQRGAGETRDTVRLWFPLVDGTARLGVLEVVIDRSKSDDTEHWEHYARLIAELSIVRGLYGDVFEFVRRRRRMTIASEVQWRLTPPLSFESNGVSIAGLLEPCYDVGGDAFDFAANGDVVHFALFDAMGHGLEAALCVTLAVSAYRNARRDMLSLRATAETIDDALAERYDGERFATAVLAELDITTGRLSWLSAGHYPPLLLRHGKLVKRGETEGMLPLGVKLADSPDPPVIIEEWLQPGDWLLLFTDGVIEARRDTEFFTVERLAEFVLHQIASGSGAAETLRRLIQAILEHQRNELQDDATTMLVEWAGPPSRPPVRARPAQRG